ncbi:MAG: hypothetical protein ABIA59_08790 [Candidatus Latescibacterota bacterium]
MNNNIRWSVWVLIIASISVIMSCGKSKDAAEDQGKRSQTDSTTIASIEGAPFKDMLEKAGFAISNAQKFPSAEAGKTGQAVAYKSKGKVAAGGVLYFKDDASRSFPTWHWYFADGAPDSVSAVELNEDGMWDVRVSMNDGTNREFVQDREFTLFSQDRSDWIALNGISSPPSDSSHAMWRCLDGRTNTAWHSSLQNSAEIYLEVPSPFGVQRGILTVFTADRGRPRECEIHADGKLIKQFVLEDQTGEQKIQLGNACQKAGTIRFIVRSSYDQNGNVDIAEFILE